MIHYCPEKLAHFHKKAYRTLTYKHCYISKVQADEYKNNLPINSLFSQVEGLYKNGMTIILSDRAEHSSESHQVTGYRYSKI